MRSLIIVPATVLLLSGVTHGQKAPPLLQIDWGTSAVFDRIVTSDGSAITTAEFNIELGGFASGFVPTANNINDWVSNWQVFDAITDPDPDPDSADFLVSSTGGPDARFAGTAFLNADGTSSSEDAMGGEVFAPGSQAYVFIRNSDTIGEGTEFLLYTSQDGVAFEFPTVTGGQEQTPLSFFASEVDEVLFGGVNGIAGPGGFTDTSTDFVLRTQTVVPEPSAALLALLASVGILTRRRRA